MKKFKRLYIEITNMCNLNCSFCPKTARPPELMSTDLFERIISEVKEHSEYLFFHVMGEPLMHPDIGRFLDICGENGCKVNLTTNGMLLGEARDKLLSKPALKKINFSMNIFDGNTPDVIVDEYLDNIFKFTELMRSRDDFITCFRFWNNENKDNVTLAQEGWDSGKNEYVTRKIEEFYKASFSVEHTTVSEKWSKVSDNVYLQHATWFDWPDMRTPDLDDKGFCLGLRQHVAILVDGTVVPCCLDREGDVKLGNIKERAFLDIVHSTRARRIYNGFSKRIIIEPLCKKCSYRRRFD